MKNINKTKTILFKEINKEKRKHNKTLKERKNKKQKKKQQFMKK